MKIFRKVKDTARLVAGIYVTAMLMFLNIAAIAIPCAIIKLSGGNIDDY
jgi:hypothetical protein